jgi:hypothetical protein
MFNGSMSSFFDIQWRHYNLVNANQLNQSSNATSSSTYNNGSGYLAGAFRPLSVMVANNAWQLVEGLIVDTKLGGIGFRNHSLPPQTTYGTTWEEDILFIEPKSECVDTNITVEFTTNSGGTRISTMNLVDHGGFSDLDKAATWWSSGIESSQEDPALRRRAYNAAWTYNALQMSILNLTIPTFINRSSTDPPAQLPYINSKNGASFLLQDRINTSTEYKPGIGMLTLLRNYGLSKLLLDYSDNSSVIVKSSGKQTPLYKNPYKITTDMFDMIRKRLDNDMITTDKKTRRSMCWSQFY